MKARLTKRYVDAAKPGKRDTFTWDTNVRGFGLKMTPAGSRVYVLQYRFNRRVRRYTIGKHGSPWTPDGARIEAERLLGMVADGKDPAGDRAADKAALTVSELCDLYLTSKLSDLAAGVEGAKKSSTLEGDQGRIRRHIKVLLGRMQARAVEQADVRRFLQDVAAGKTATDVRTGPRGRAIVEGGKGTATRVVGLLGGIFTFAIEQGIRPDNPVRGVKRFTDGKGERYLSTDELARLGDALVAAEEEGENSFAIAGIRLLMLSGCRKSEILTLQWAHVDFEFGCLRLPDSKTGEKVVPLGAPTLELLASLSHVESNPYVLPGEKEGAHLVGLPKVWARVRARAGLSDVRLHDLRHGFASIGASAGMGLPIVGRLLGHKDPATTARYAHIGSDPAKAAADSIAGTIAAAMNGENGNGGEVVELSRKA